MEAFSELAPTVPEVAMEKGIVKLVGILNSKGLVTKLSCEGHVSRGVGAWVEIEGAHFKSYARRRKDKLEKFLLAGEGLWKLILTYRARSVFPGLGQPRPRLRKMRRKTIVDLIPTFCLEPAVVAQGSRSSELALRAMERAAKRFL